MIKVTETVSNLTVNNKLDLLLEGITCLMLMLQMTERGKTKKQTKKASQPSVRRRISPTRKTRVMWTTEEENRLNKLKNLGLKPVQIIKDVELKKRHTEKAIRSRYGRL